MTKAKICGITTLEDARFASAAGADYLGFIQYEGSPRYVGPKVAKEIIAWVYGPEAVGVFVNATAEAINTTAEDVGFHLVQLHGDEPPALCAEIERPVIKALRIPDQADAGQVMAHMDRYASHVDFFLLDTYKAGQYGGTGETFNWELARILAQDYPLFLAGGIGPANVADAVRQVAPYAVDLSSSVEERPGVKDFDQLTAFFDAFHEATETS